MLIITPYTTFVDSKYERFNPKKSIDIDIYIDIDIEVNSWTRMDSICMHALNLIDFDLIDFIFMLTL